MRIALTQIHSSPHPVRTSWDEDKLNELTESIREYGVIQPIKVRPNANGYEIVYGHRRTEAARRAGLTDIDAIVEGLDDQTTLIQALIENVQREDMSPLDTARGLKALKDVTGWSNREIERRGIMSNMSISEHLLLLNETEEVQQMLTQVHDGHAEPQISVKHIHEARRVLTSPIDKIAVLQKAADEGLTVTQMRKVAESVAAAPSEQAKRVILEQEYSTAYHDPEWIRQRAQQFGAHDPLYRAETPKATTDWQTSPEVINVVDTMKDWLRLLTDFRKASDVGKMSPEAKQFIARRARQFADALTEWADNLEG